MNQSTNTRARAGSSAFLPIVIATAAIVLAVSRAAGQGAGPAQGEFSRPGGSGGGARVDEFTGAFTMEIPVIEVPGPDGSGFSMSLSYRSGAPIEQDASWVGYGWALNAGAIMRDRRGFADDWKGSVTTWNKTRRLYTVSATRELNTEVMSTDLKEFLEIPVDPNFVGPPAPGDPPAPNVAFKLSLTTTFNNMTGYSRSFGVGAAAKGLLSLDYTSKEGGSFSARVEPGLFLKGLRMAGALDGASPEAEQDMKAGSYAAAMLTNSVLSYEQNLPTPFTARFTGGSIDYTAKALAAANPAFLLGVEVGVTGNYTWFESVPRTVRNAAGYMYSQGAAAGTMMDYYSERDGAYRKDNPFLPIPFTNADNFILSGSGAAGSFRLFNRGLGQFRPDEASSSLMIMQVGVDVAFGLRFGLGGNFGYGLAAFSGAGWSGNHNSSYAFQGAGACDPYIFRMHGDLGGSVAYSTNDNAERAAVAPHSILGAQPAIPSSYFAQANNGAPVGRSSNVGYHTFAEMNRLTDGGVYIDSYTRDSATRALVDRTDPTIQDQIGEFCVMTPGGYRYVYGLPVFSRAEKSMGIGLPKHILDSMARMNSRRVAHAYLNTDNAPTVVGEERATPYAVSYLLTLITTPDYVDRTNDGPTPDDFGGYTKFNYVRSAGAKNKSNASNASAWFGWRAPHNGLRYNRNTLSDPGDDIGSYASGQREVYYLSSIETKTHIAYFVTNRTNITAGARTIKGSLTQRADAYQAFRPSASVALDARLAGDSTYSQAGYGVSITGATVPLTNASRVLERIELYTKNANGSPGELITTTHFEYDNSLRKGQPNARRAAPPPSTAQRPGMLTLRKLWFSGANVRSADYSPYQFGYEYRPETFYSQSIRTRYPDITGFAADLTAQMQNPDYSPVDADAWGNYQAASGERYAAMKTWLNQAPDTTTFDPAAWQLKWIRTPSLGEIQVQYEQNTYAYVQDRPAMAMVSLAPSGSYDDVGGHNKYYLNVAEIGVDETDQAEVERLRDMMTAVFMKAGADGRKERAYFKLLYALVGDVAQRDSAYIAEYIRGYSPVRAVGIDQVAPQGGQPARYRLYISLEGERIPKKVCGEYVRKNRMGLMGPDDGLPNTDNGPGMVSRLLFEYARAAYVEADHCRAIDYANSYIRIPLVAAKRGGGVRVRRLLSFDRGNGTNEQLTGAEYLYEDYDPGRHATISSGVAVNEPAAIREENALTNVWGTWSKPELDGRIVAGEDIGRFEGVPGESLLPAAGVGYSRVVARNIHAGKSNPGFSVSRFHTAKEYPFLTTYAGLGRSVDFTPIDQHSHRVMPISGGVPQVATIMVGDDDLWMSQGYRFVLNNMHGQFRGSAAYGGSYTDRSTWSLASSREVSYFEPGESVPLFNAPGPLAPGSPGKEMDVAIEHRQYDQDVLNGYVEGDLSIGFPPFTVVPSAQGYVKVTTGTLATHVASKVVRYPAIPRTVVTYADGVYHYARNEAFDPLSGTPVLAHTTDGYDGLKLQSSQGGQRGGYHSYTFTAAGQYPGMGQAARNEHQVLKNAPGLTITKTAGTPHTVEIAASGPGADATLCGLDGILTAGDLIRLRVAGGTSERGLYHVDAVTRGRTITAKLVPVSTAVAAANNQAGAVDLEIIRSGYANQLLASAGSVTSYGTMESQVLSGTNIHLQPQTQMMARNNVATMLNGLLQQGGGSMLAVEMEAMGVKLADPATGQCGSHALWITPNGPNNEPVVSLDAPYPGSQSFAILGGAGGSFSVNSKGDLVYTACASGCCAQPVPSVVFCNNLLHPGITVQSTIAASATTYSHVHPYDLAETPATPSDANAYERGERGRWRPTASYAYRTGITGGSGRLASERNYLQAGIFKDFRLLNWKYPTLSTAAGKWLRTDSVTAYSPDGVPLETVNIEGLYSSTRLVGDRTLPLLAASNARHGSVAFQDFEEPPQGLVLNQGPLPAHTGVRSLCLGGAAVTTTLASARVTDQTLAGGIAVRLWVRVSDDDITAALPLGPHSVSVKLAAGPWNATVRLAPQYMIARTGEWTLYEVPTEMPGAETTHTVTLAIDANLGLGEEVCVDDIRIQPRDAIVQTYVFDRAKKRPVAVLDDMHFATYNQYNAEGRLVRRRRETARGVRTVVEAHDHLPKLTRHDGELMGDPGPPEMPAPPSRRRIPAPGSQGAIASPNDPSRLDLLDAELGAEGLRARGLGARRWRAIDPAALERLDLDSIGFDDLPGADKLRMLRELATLEERAEQLRAEAQREAAEHEAAEHEAAEHEAADAAVADAAAAEARRRARRAAEAEIERRRDEVLRTLGIGPDDWERMTNDE